MRDIYFHYEPKLIIVKFFKKRNKKYHSQCNSLLLRRTVLCDRSDPCRPLRRSLLKMGADRRSLLKILKKSA